MVHLKTKLAIKRAIDIAFSHIFLVVFSPLIAVLACLVVYMSGWPPFVRIVRIGKGGKPFYIYKLRTMVNGAHEHKKDVYGHDYRVQPKKPDDPRITPIGKILRKTSVDELPQLLNVLKGDMSLVGPRPKEPAECLFDTKYLNCVQLHRPGMTGLSQIMGRGDITLDKANRLNGWYVKLWSLRMDFYILWRTIVVVCRRTGAC